MRKYSLVRKRVRGGSLKSFFNKANEFLKKNKIISRGLKAYSSIPFLPYGSHAKMFGTVADTLGYGKRAKSTKRGGMLRSAGMTRRYGGMLRMSGK